MENHPDYRDLHLIIIGDEISRHPDVRRAVIHSRVEHCVRFLGFIPIDTLRIFHELATAFVFPSLYEGFGLPPLEAMASGTPVIASAMSSLPEVVGGAAMLVNPENVFDIARGITEVLLDDELRKELIVKGAQTGRPLQLDAHRRRGAEALRRTRYRRNSPELTLPNHNGNERDCPHFAGGIEHRADRVMRREHFRAAAGSCRFRDSTSFFIGSRISYLLSDARGGRRGARLSPDAGRPVHVEQRRFLPARRRDAENQIVDGPLRGHFAER